jgi:DNA polymerase-3 subunit delta'
MVASFFSPLIGQSQAIALLTQAVNLERIAPAYLFAGPNGVGRSLAARCFAELILSQPATDPSPAQHRRIQERNHPDLLWVEPTYSHQGKRLSVTDAVAAGIQPKSAPLVRLEQIREIGPFLAHSPLQSDRFVVVIEAAETMPEGAANGLLKTLEEPGHATLILIAPGVESLLPTLVSRCQRIPFYRLPVAAMQDILTRSGYADILHVPEILSLAQGSPGAAIGHWQKLQNLPDDLLPQLLEPPQSVRQALTLARQIDQTMDLEVQRWLIDYLQQRYWQLGAAASDRWSLRLQPLRSLEKARDFLHRNVQPRLVWEVTLLDMVQP